jgi:hypothetical protein
MAQIVSTGDHGARDSVHDVDRLSSTQADTHGYAARWRCHANHDRGP